MILGGLKINWCRLRKKIITRENVQISECSRIYMNKIILENRNSSSKKLGSEKQKQGSSFFNSPTIMKRAYILLMKLHLMVHQIPYCIKKGGEMISNPFVLVQGGEIL